jgi:hypothetical protein
MVFTPPHYIDKAAIIKISGIDMHLTSILFTFRTTLTLFSYSHKPISPKL